MAKVTKLPAQEGNKDILWSETPVSGYEHDKLIGIARTQLLIKAPFFGRLTMRLVPTPTNMIPTAAVDPKGRMYYNEKFLNACTIEDAMFVVAHEVMHLVQRCSSRFPEGGQHKIWNMASDIVVNIILDQAEISPRPEWRKEFLGFEDKYRQYEKKLITDYIYYDLIKDIKDNSDCEACKQIAKGILEENKQRSDKQRKEQAKEENGEHSHGDGEECNHGDSDSDSDDSGSGNSGGTDAGNNGTLKHTCGNPQGCCAGVTSDIGQAQDPDDAEAFNQWQRNILNAAEGANRGTLPGAVQEMLKELVEPSISWKDIVRATGTPIYGKDRYSYKRNSRRGLALNIFLPSTTPEKKGGLVFLDTSGSISDEEITQFCGEVTGIMSAIGCKRILIGLHDTIVYDLVEVGKDDMTKKLKFARGGTSHIDVFDLANGQESAKGFKLPHGFDVGMIICFTDLATEFPASPPKWPVIWGVPSQYRHAKSPWGKQVEVILQKGNRS
jgi:predicted metal-dependent peptidase